MVAAPDPAPSHGGAQAVTRALSLLSLVGAGLGLADLAAAALTRPTVRRLLLALLAVHLIETRLAALDPASPSERKRRSA